MNKRRELVIAPGVSAVVAPLSSYGQPQTKVWRIETLETVSPELNAANLDAFRQQDASTCSSYQSSSGAMITRQSDGHML